MKILWFDVESTGLDPIKNDIVTLAGIIEINGEVKEKFYLKIQPTNWDTIEEKALKVNGLTLEDLKSFDSPKDAHKKLLTIFEKYVNRYDKLDKFQPAGFNVEFDMRFLAEFFKKVGDKYFGSWIDYHKIDVSSLVQILHLKGVLTLENYRLATASARFGIQIKAHDALSDIEATRNLCHRILTHLEFKEVPND